MAKLSCSYREETRHKPTNKRSPRANSYLLTAFAASDTSLNYGGRSGLALCFSCSLTWKLKFIQDTSLLFLHLFWKHQDIFVHFTSPLLTSAFSFLSLFTVWNYNYSNQSKSKMKIAQRPYYCKARMLSISRALSMKY